ncbi:hypothetical protein B0H14DRAFT_2604660 [Mycena olivaceomarginata]|nr:hypothetical protein B0H14DRAFT_2604660 [Mycena olivaceomarginata]
MGKFAVCSDLDSRPLVMNPMPNVQSGEEACISTTERGQFLPIMGKFAVDSYLESRIRLVREVFNPSTDKLGLSAECSDVGVPSLALAISEAAARHGKISWQFGYVFEDPAQAWGDEASRDQSPSFPSEHRKHKGGQGKGSSSETVLIITSIFTQEVAGSAAAQES